MQSLSPQRYQTRRQPQPQEHHDHCRGYDHSSYVPRGAGHVTIVTGVVVGIIVSGTSYPVSTSDGLGRIVSPIGVAVSGVCMSVSVAVARAATATVAYVASTVSAAFSSASGFDEVDIRGGWRTG